MDELDNKKVDLHLHSSKSDGLYTPTSIVKLALKYKLSAISITDHETTAGVHEALEAGKYYGLEVVPGVEVGAYLKNRELHILGYYPGEIDKLEDTLNKYRNERFERMDRMLYVLKKLSLPVNWNEVENEAGNAAPGRLHLARLMFKKGYVLSIDEAFEKYLEKGKPVYIPRVRLQVEEAIKLLIDCNAIPVLAHPGTTNEDTQVLNYLKNAGLKGIEAYHPEHNVKWCLFYEQWAVSKGLVITGGSDFHGDEKESCPHPGYVSVKYSYLDNLKLASANI